MSIPGQAATSETTNTASVSDLVKQVTKDEAGNYVFPEGVTLTDEIKLAVTSEKRRRDTQGEFTKVNQAKITLEAENSKLKEELLKTKISFTPEQVEELEDLKLENPEKWRSKLNEYENAHLEAQREKITNLSTQVKTEAAKNFEVTTREQVLNDFNTEHKVGLTEELLAEEVPLRITKKLNSGTITYEEFLEESLVYLKTNKAIKEEPVMNNPNLNSASGGREPGVVDLEPSLGESYKNDIY